MFYGKLDNLTTNRFIYRCCMDCVTVSVPYYAAFHALVDDLYTLRGSAWYICIFISPSTGSSKKEKKKNVLKTPNYKRIAVV